MKRKIIKPDKDFELAMQAKKSEHQFLRSDEEIDKANIYWLACAYASPFIPMIDLSFVLDELKKDAKAMVSKEKERYHHL